MIIKVNDLFFALNLALAVLNLHSLAEQKPPFKNLISTTGRSYISSYNTSIRKKCNFIKKVEKEGQSSDIIKGPAGKV